MKGASVETIILVQNEVTITSHIFPLGNTIYIRVFPKIGHSGNVDTIVLGLNFVFLKICLKFL